MVADAGNIWSLIETLAAGMPLNKERVEAILHAHLRERVKDENIWHFAASSTDVGAAGISVVNLVLNPAGQLAGNGGLSIEIDRVCIRREELMSRYPGLAITQTPRGRSLQEVTVYSKTTPWGELSFAYRETNPDCLFRVGFRPPRSN